MTNIHMGDGIDSNFYVDLEYADFVQTQMKTVTERGRAAVKQAIEKANRRDQLKLIDEMIVEEFGQKVLSRRYSMKEAAEMVGVSTETIRNAEKDGRLPEPEYRADTKSKQRLGYTIDQVNYMRDVFGTRPVKPEGMNAIVIGILNQKGGSTKSTTVVHMSHYLAIKGYRVLVVDLDAQGTTSFSYGKLPNIQVEYWETVAPYLLREDDDDEDGTSYSTLDYAIQNTHWGNVDIIPCAKDYLEVDMNMAKNWSSERPVDMIMQLRKGLLQVGVNYDFIIIDGAPSLSVNTMNTVSACDTVFTPVPAQMFDLASTVEFSDLIDKLIETYKSHRIPVFENQRIVGYKDMPFMPNLPSFYHFITRYSKSDYSKAMETRIRQIFTTEVTKVLKNEIYRSDEIGKSSNQVKSVYEINPGADTNNRGKLKSDIEMLDNAFEEMLDIVVDEHWK
ncbi:AAA family ATPase [Reinekea sp. G2M2-21]|uniref:AAA family ATPase n=1 Tax=Reinekea sp. G2M2-21 TaxID=2788942 RepID=UPI0018A95A8C|nr:AAA family ATPase [Reinekea sp. G2M2-21]